MHKHFDHIKGHFTSVGVSAEWVAFENLCLGRGVSEQWGHATYTKEPDGTGLIDISPAAISGSTELEFALWREIARALDGVESLRGSEPQVKGRISYAAASLLRKEAELITASLRLKVAPVQWIETTSIPGSLSVNDPDEVVCLQAGNMSASSRAVLNHYWFSPSELFAQLLPQFIAYPGRIDATSRELGRFLRRVVLYECGLFI